MIGGWSGNSAEQIAAAKRLLDAATTTQVEFERLKAQGMIVGVQPTS